MSCICIRRWGIVATCLVVICLYFTGWAGLGLGEIVRDFSSSNLVIISISWAIFSKDVDEPSSFSTKSKSNLDASFVTFFYWFEIFSVSYGPTLQCKFSGDSVKYRSLLISHYTSGEQFLSIKLVSNWKARPSLKFFYLIHSLYFLNLVVTSG